VFPEEDGASKSDREPAGNASAAPRTRGAADLPTGAAHPLARIRVTTVDSVDGWSARKWSWLP